MALSINARVLNDYQIPVFQFFVKCIFWFNFYCLSLYDMVIGVLMTMKLS